jgi:aminoglycoside phosphotransferase (APT) family kinase protein
MVIPKNRDAEALAKCLTGWMAGQIPGARDLEIVNIRVPRTGNSNETAFFELAWNEGGQHRRERLVARIQPSEYQLFLDADVLWQYRMMEAIAAHSTLPVPPLFWSESDPAVLGGPFFIMGHVDGQVAAERPSYHRVGWVVDLVPSERERLAHNAMSVLAEVARLDWRRGFEFLSDGIQASALRRYLRWVRDWYTWAARGREMPLLQAGLDYLDAHQPEENSCGIVWGDARLGNMIIADDLTVAAVIDWEMATLGPREVDLGWWLFFEEFLTDGFGLAPLDGIPRRPEMISEYQSLTGHQVHDIEYYEILAAVRMAIIVIAGTDGQIRSGRLPASTTVATNNPATQILARHLGLSEPRLAPEYARHPSIRSMKEH